MLPSEEKHWLCAPSVYVYSANNH